MPIELRFASVLAAPLDVVWERASAVSGANDELWPLAKMTFPLRLDRRVRRHFDMAPAEAGERRGGGIPRPRRPRVS